MHHTTTETTANGTPPGRRTSARSLLALAALLIAGFLLAACGDDDDDDADADEAGSSGSASLIGTEWVITSLETPDGTMDAPDDATMTFEDGTAEVATGCNDAGGPAVVDGDTITFGPLAATQRACEPPLDTWEAALLAFLDGEVTFDLSGDTLTMTKGEETLTLADV